jgi:hypothetical protein
MSATINRRNALIGLIAAMPSASYAEPVPKQKPGEEFAVLTRPAQFDMNPQSGYLKETVQKGQDLIWHLQDHPDERRFQISNISIAFLRSETGGEVKMSFSCNIATLGYAPTDGVKLNVIVRSKGGAALHSWSFTVPVKCADKNQAIPAITSNLPKDFAANVFNNVSTVEVGELTEPSALGIKVVRCPA